MTNSADSQALTRCDSVREASCRSNNEESERESILGNAAGRAAGAEDIVVRMLDNELHG